MDGNVVVKDGVRSLLRRLGYVVIKTGRPDLQAGAAPYGVVLPGAEYSPWLTDEAFLETYQAIRAHTLVDIYRCYELWMLVEQSRKLDGALLEVGVWRGGTGALIAKRARSLGIAEPVFLCDTFKGVVKTSERDSSYAIGEHADTSRETVQALAERMSLDNVRILEGVFPEETAALVDARRIRLCHIDVDVYRSAVETLEWVWDRLVVGGIVVYDDYGFRRCDGITRHVEEQRARSDRLVVHNLNGHALVIKVR
jgi:O-methyltransferase